ncbi:MAG: hypothetical protein R3B93_19050 [Bacteroidia bacterium]
MEFEKFSSVPFGVFYPSARVDFLHLIFCKKPAIRVQVKNSEDLIKVKNWSSNWNYYLAFDEAFFVCISPIEILPLEILTLDQSPEAHERKLGNLLGYPPCCCEFIEFIGEKNIEKLENEVKNWIFLSPFDLINPQDYFNGGALICHIPCSVTCKPSLDIAHRAHAIINENKGKKIFKNWEQWMG